MVATTRSLLRALRGRLPVTNRPRRSLSRQSSSLSSSIVSQIDSKASFSERVLRAGANCLARPLVAARGESPTQAKAHRPARVEPIWVARYPGSWRRAHEHGVVASGDRAATEPALFDEAPLPDPPPCIPLAAARSQAAGTTFCRDRAGEQSALSLASRRPGRHKAGECRAETWMR